MFGFSAFSEVPFSTLPTAIVPPAPIVIDTHDGDGKKEKKRFEKEVERNKYRKKQIIDAFEIVIESRPKIAADFAKPYLKSKSKDVLTTNIDIDLFYKNIEKVENLLKIAQEIDDEEVLLLL